MTLKKVKIMPYKKGLYHLSMMILFTMSIQVLGSCPSMCIGSDTTVNRFNTQQTLFTGFRVASFAALQGGFDIFGSLSQATFDSFFGVSGSVALNSGTLILNRDLILQDNCVFNTIGNIVGNGHVLELAASVTLIQASPLAASNCIVTPLNSQGYGRDLESIAFSNDDQFMAFATGEGRPDTTPGAVVMYSISPATGLTLLLSQTLTSNFIITTQVDFRPKTPASTYQFAFTRGSTGSVDEELIVFNWDPNANVLTRLDGRSFGGSISALSCRFDPTGNFLAIVTGDNFGDYSGFPALLTNTADANARIRLYSVSAGGVLTETTSSIANAGSLYTLGKTIRPRTLEWDVTGNFLSVGTTQLNGSGSGGPAATPIDVYVFSFSAIAGGATPGALTALNAKILAPQNTTNTANSADIRGMDWHPTFTDFIMVVSNGNGSANNINMFQHFPTTPSGGNPGSLVLQNISGTADLSLAGNAIANSWSPDGRCAGVGAAVNPTFVIYDFKKTGTALTLNTSASFTAGAELEAFEWSHQGTLLATGDDVPVITAYLANAFNPTCAIFSNLGMYLNNNLELSNVCLTFTGNSFIDGQGHCLTIDSTSTIIVGSNSSLALKDIIIVNVSDSFIKCTDATSTLTFKDAQLELAGNYTFTTGHFDVLSDLRIVGDGLAFVYQSNVVSTIQPDGRLILDHGVTFSYAPAIANRNLLSFVDSTAQLLLKGATLFSTVTGLQLTKGQVVVDSNSFLSCDGTVDGQAISFGDGISSANNVTIQWLPAATLEILKGRVVYNNV